MISGTLFSKFTKLGEVFADLSRRYTDPFPQFLGRGSLLTVLMHMSQCTQVNRQPTDNNIWDIFDWHYLLRLNWVTSPNSTTKEVFVQFNATREWFGFQWLEGEWIEYPCEGT
jgi:hypothetical protein